MADEFLPRKGALNLTSLRATFHSPTTADSLEMANGQIAGGEKAYQWPHPLTFRSRVQRQDNDEIFPV